MIVDPVVDRVNVPVPEDVDREAARNIAMAGTNSGTLADRRSNRLTIGAKAGENLEGNVSAALASLKDIEDHGHCQ